MLDSLGALAEIFMVEKYVFSTEIFCCMCFLLLSFSQVQNLISRTILVNRTLEMPVSFSTGKAMLHPTSVFLMLQP